MRLEVYRQLADHSIEFDKLDHIDRLDIIIRGLSDSDKDVKSACKHYLVQAICAIPGEVPEILKEKV